MNHISQRNRLESTLKSYMYFMAYCPIDSFLKLSAEMLKIYERIEQIKLMDAQESRKEVFVQYETKQSRVNFIDFVPTIAGIELIEKIYKTKKIKLKQNDK